MVLLMIKRKICLSLLMLGVSACSTVTLSPDGKNKLVNKPTYEESKPFYFWGVVGEHHIEVLAICQTQEPLQMQSQQTLSDSVLALLTIGIYAPHTAKVWCPKEEL